MFRLTSPSRFAEMLTAQSKPPISLWTRSGVSPSIPESGLSLRVGVGMVTFASSGSVIVVLSADPEAPRLTVKGLPVS